MKSKRFMKEIVMELAKELAVAALPQAVAQPQADGDRNHELKHLHGRETRVCPVCGKKAAGSVKDAIVGFTPNAFQN